MMKYVKRSIERIFSLVLSMVFVMSLCAFAKKTASNENNTQAGSGAAENENTVPTASRTESNETYVPTITTDLTKLVFDNSAWSYDADNDVYWQISVVYCADPETTEYESLGIYVPGVYLTGTENADGTYSCTVNNNGKVGSYSAVTSPIIMPVNTAGYSAQKAPTSYNYDSISSYLEAGFIYVYAGCRGRDNGYDSNGNLIYNGGAPWGVTDLKAAVRYLRYNSGILPGDTESIFTFGHSGGGAQSALMGATGDSELYYAYLESVGAAMVDDNGKYISDAIYGAMAWCPITSLDYANEAYEWMMGQYFTTNTRDDSTWTSGFSDDLSETYAEYINELGLTDEAGTVLTLSATENGIYTSGSYYDYLISEIERSLNNFLSDNTFPYTSGGNSERPDGGFAGGGERSGNEKPSGDMPSEGIPSGDMPSGNGPMSGSSSKEAVTYETAQDYIDSLNSDIEWAVYDSKTNTVKITSVEAFVTHCKNAGKSVGAFDDLNRNQAENKVFGDNTNDTLHFDSVMAKLLEENQEKYGAYSDWDMSYTDAYKEYLTSVDALGNSSLYRQNMYNPMYYLSEYYNGYGTSTPAAYWRIHTGITQSDTALTVEMNLALALEQYESVEAVDFEMVWEQGHTMAERTGNSIDNFIDWVNECLNN